MVIKDVAGRAACSNKHGLAHAIWDGAHQKALRQAMALATGGPLRDSS